MVRPRPTPRPSACVHPRPSAGAPQRPAGIRRGRTLAWLATLGLLSGGALGGCGGAPIVPAPELSESEAPAAVVAKGLRLSVGHRPESGSVAAHLTLPAGSAYETAAHAGAAALLGSLVLGEHAPDGLQARIAALGGEAWAWQTVSHAHYALSVPAAQAEEALDLLARAVLKPDLSPAAIAAHLRGLDQAQGRQRAAGARGVLDRLLGLLTVDVNPALPGSAALGALDGALLEAFHRQSAVTGGAALAVVGDLDPAAARAAVARSFADLPAGRPTAPGGLAPPAGGPQVEVVTGGRSALTLAWPVPVPDVKAAAALDALAVLLAGPEGRVAQSLRQVGVPVRGLRAWTWLVGPGRGIFVLEVSVADPEAAWGPVLTEVLDLADRPPAPARLGLVQSALETLAATREDDPGEEAARRATQAATYAESETGAWLGALRALTPAHLRTAALPLGAGTLAAVVEVAAAPAGEEAPDPALWGERLAEQATAAAHPPAPADVGVLTLEPGLQALLHPMPAARTVTVYAVVEGGWAVEPEGQGGMAALVAAGLGRTRAGEPPVTARVWPDHVSLSVTVPPAALERALEAIAGRLGPLEWTPAQVETARVAAAPRAQAPALAAQNHLWQLWRPGADSALAELTPGQIRAFHDAHVAHAPVRVVLAGAVDPLLATRALRPLTGRQRRPLTRPGGPAVAEALSDRAEAAAAPAAAPSDPAAPTDPGAAGDPAAPGDPAAAGDLAAAGDPAAAFASPDAAEAPRAADPAAREARLATDGERAGLAVVWPILARTPTALAAASLLAELLVSPDGPLGEALASGALVGEVRPLDLAAGPWQLVGVRLAVPAAQLAAARAALDSTADRLARIGPGEEELNQARARLDGRLHARLDRSATRAAWLAGHLRAHRGLEGPDALRQVRAELMQLVPATLARAARVSLVPENRLRAEVSPTAPPGPGAGTHRPTRPVTDEPSKNRQMAAMRWSR